MPVSVTMPRLGESVTEGTVTRWLKREGDQVAVDEPLLEVSTDKVDTEIPSPAAGVLSRIVVAEDETAAVGAELGVIAGPGESTGTPAASATTAPAAATTASAPAEVAAPPVPAAVAPVAAAPTAPTPPAPTSTAGDSTAVRMPALGESVTEGTVTRWLKQVGDRVEADEPLLEVSTDKVDTEIPSPVAGIVVQISVVEDEVALVGAELARIGSAVPAPTSAPAAAVAPPPTAPTPPTTPTQPKTPAQPLPPTAAPAARPVPPAASSATEAAGESESYVTPLVRKLATEHSVDLSTVVGTGVGGRIRRQDVLSATRGTAPARPASVQAPAPVDQSGRAVTARPPMAPSTEPSPLRGKTEKISRLRSVIAKRMVESLQISAQLTTVVEVDVTRVAKLREQTKAAFAAKHGVKLSFLPFFALATVQALQANPTLNASLDVQAGTVTYHEAEHLGIAVDTERGLVVPVIRGAGELNLAGLAQRIADLADRTRTNKITPDELSNGTFTLTNTGSRGALFDTPIINQPQVGILGTGTVVRRPVVVDDHELGEIVAIRSMVYLAITYDHRLVDGANAARFLGTIKERLEAGAFEADLGL